MNDVNSVALIGRLAKDADIKYLQSGTAVVNFNLAVNESVKNGNSWNERASFFDVVFYGRQGESLSRYLDKGKQVAITGTLLAKDGQTKSKIVIIAKTIQLLGSARDGNMGGMVSTPPAGEDDYECIPF